MPFLLLLLLMAACIPVAWPGPPEWLGPVGGGLLTGAAMAVMVGAAALVARWTRRELARDPGWREVVLQRYSAYRLYHFFGLFAVYGLTLTVLGWGGIARMICTPGGAEEMLPGAELVILAPFLAAMVLSWACFYDAERALHDAALPPGFERPFWPRGAYVGFHVRQNFALIVVPLALLIVQQGFVRQFPDLKEDWRFQTAGLCLFAVVFIGMPWILRLFLRSKPLPEGPLRQRLLAAAQRLDFRCSDILLWHTRGGVANALVVGILPALRYVLLTDRLANDLTADEVEAVFGHEVGHVKHHHMLYYLGFLVISLTAIMGTWSAVYDAFNLAPLLTAHQDWSVLPLLGIFGTYIFVVFGFLSRRCERQADIYGCRAVSCAQPDCLVHGADVAPVPGGRSLCPTGIRTFIRALEKVAYLNGISRSRPGWLQSWQHSTIARRVEFLQRILTDPGIEPRFQQRVGLVKWSLLLGLGSLLVVLGATQGWKVLLPF